MKRTMRITYLDFDDTKNPLLGAGQARATQEVASRLVQRGHEAEVICSRYPGAGDRIEKGITYTHIGLGSRHLRLNNLVYNLLVPFYVRRLRSDLIVECLTPPCSWLLSPLFTKIPVVAIPTSFEAVRFREKYHLPFDLVERYAARYYTYFLPATADARTKMRRLNPHVISKVVPQGVADEYLRVRGKKGKYIVFLGRMDISQKGLDLLLAAYAKIAPTVRTPLLLAGHGVDQGKVRELIRQWGLRGRVRLLGPTYGKEKLRLFGQSQVFVVPSRHEGFCIAALEALASGLPIVAFDIPGLAWIPDTVSLKAKPFDVDSFARLLLRAVDEKVNARLRRNCGRVAKRYSWDRVTTDYERFFRRVLKKAQAGE